MLGFATVYTVAFFCLTLIYRLAQFHRTSDIARAVIEIGFAARQHFRQRGEPRQNTEYRINTMVMDHLHAFPQHPCDTNNGNMMLHGHRRYANWRFTADRL